MVGTKVGMTRSSRADEIDEEVGKLPPGERETVKNAIRRIDKQMMGYELALWKEALGYKY
jgi:hypothetical protein